MGLPKRNAGEDVGEREPSFTHFWWDCKLVHPLVCSVKNSQKLVVALPYNIPYHVMAYIPKGLNILEMFTVALCTTVKNGNRKSPSPGKWIMKMCYTQ